jgi:isopenicillin-N epimerase
MMGKRRIDQDADWEDLGQQWTIRPDTLYLNHGSFGPPPRAVVQARRQWQERMDSQPMDFFFRQWEPAWRDARGQLAEFLGTSADRLILVENATVAMNLVAQGFPLRAGEEVALTDHEYGAVRRIWERRAQSTRATVRTITLPRRFESQEEVVDSVASQWNSATRLLVISHITSPTAIRLPVEAIIRRAAEAEIPVCVDGPHAIAQVPLDLDQLGCAYYAASCHKWLAAPFGSGFLHVAPTHQHLISPATLSWGRLPPAIPEHWTEEFCWSGTRDYSAYLALPAAIQFLKDVGLEAFRARTQYLAGYARQRLVDCFRMIPLTSDDPCWHTAMAHVPLPATDGPALQRALWERFAIEVPIVEFQGECFARVSCHLYTRRTDIDRLVTALRYLVGNANRK